jgi:hypothetical protein
MPSKRRTLSAVEISAVAAAAAAVAIGVTDFGARAEVKGTEETEAEGKETETETGRGKRSLEPEGAGKEAEEERTQAMAAAAGTAEAAAKARRKVTILRCAPSFCSLFWYLLSCFARRWVCWTAAGILSLSHREVVGSLTRGYPRRLEDHLDDTTPSREKCRFDFL